jgi:hypothetical protein
MSDYSTEQVREILQREADLRLALKVARAQAFLRWMAGRDASQAIAWQETALETADLEQEYEQARTEKLVLYLVTGGDLDGHLLDGTTES